MIVTTHGYVKVFVGFGHHLADSKGYAYEHRIVAEKKFGRKLLAGEIVHHVDGNRQNNMEENISVVHGNRGHFVHHRNRTDLRKPGEENPSVLCLCGCGRIFLKYDQSGRPRKYVSGHNPPRATTIKSILSALQNGYPKNIDDLLFLIPVSKVALKCCLSKMYKKGMVLRLRLGVYGRPNYE